MIASEETSIQLALENERWTIRRQALLKRLWKLRQTRARDEESARAAAARADQAAAPTA